MVLVARRLHALESHGLAGAVCEIAVGGAAMWMVVGAIERIDAGRTAEGPLGDQVLGGRRLALWHCAEGAGVLLVLGLLSMAGVVFGAPSQAARLSLTLAIGAVLAATAIVQRDHVTGRPGNVRRRAGGARPRQRHARPVAAAAILALGAGAAALARRNNADPALASVLLGVAGVIAGARLGRIDPPLLRFLGHEPTALSSLLARSAGVPALATAVTVGVTAIVVGLSPPTALGLSAGSGIVVGAYMATAALHALGGMNRLTAAAAAADLVLLGAIAAVSAPVAPAWAVARAIMLTVSARRRRWLEC